MFDDFAGDDGHEQSTIVEMFDRELTAAECGEKIDLELREQVITLSAETLMRLLIDLNDHVSRARSRSLVTLTMESDRLAALHALVDMDLEHLLLAVDLLTVTRLTLVLVIDHLSCARTLVARALKLLDHRTHLPERDAYAAAGTAIAGPDRTLLSALAVTLGTYDAPSERKFGRLALVEVFKGYVNAMHKVFRSSRSLWPSAAATEESAATSAE